MTTAELQAHIAALNEAAARGEIEVRDRAVREGWRPFRAGALIEPDCFRIKQQPHEVLILVHPETGAVDSRIYVRGMTIDAAEGWEPHKFREVIGE